MMPRPTLHSSSRRGRGFTLLEVMVAIGILGIALLALLGLQHQGLQSVIHSQDMTQAAMLAQALMTEVDTQGFPALGNTRGDFGQLFPGRFPNFRWQRNVVGSGFFPDVRKVQVAVLFGPRQTRRFMLTEFVHNPTPAQAESPEQGAGP